MSILHFLDDSDFDELVINSRIGIKLIDRALEQSELPENVKSQIKSILNNQMQKEKIQTIVERIIEVRRSLNMLFKNQSIKAFESNESVIYLLKPCLKEDDFNNLILIMSGIIEKDLTEFKDVVTLPSGQNGSISAYNEYFKTQYGVSNYNGLIISNLRDIFTLRSKKFPTHVDTTQWISKVNSLGFDYPINDWQGLGFKCLELYFESLSNTLTKIS